MRQVGTDRLVSEYLERLDRALSGLPSDRHSQLVAEIADHISTARDSLVDPTEADILNLLDRLGSPEAIAAEAGEGELTPLALAPQRGLHESLAIALLLFGGFLFGVGWLVGVFLLWTSGVWRVKEKILGTLVFPGGLATALILAGELLTVAHARGCVQNIPSGGAPISHCVATSSGGIPEIAGVVLLVALFVLPVVVAVHLHRASKGTDRVGPRGTSQHI